MSTAQTQQSSLKALIAKGKEQNYLTYAQVNDHLPDTISDPDQVEDIIQMIDDMGIKVFQTAPDADQLLMIEARPMSSLRLKRLRLWLRLRMKPVALPTLCECTCARWVLLNC